MTRILIIEDQPTLARNLARGVQADGAEAEVACSIHAARALLDAHRFDLLLLDVRLPDGDGLALLEEIRGAHPTLPALVMSGEGTNETAQRAAALGAAAFLAKPFPLRILREQVRAATRSVDVGVRNADRHGPTASSATVMMYSHDGFGVGHLRRTINIATRLVREQPAVNVLVLCGSPSIGLFDLPRGVDVVKLPSIVKVRTNEWQPGSLSLAAGQVRELREQLILRTVELFKPAALLVDHMPKGVWGDLLPVLEYIRSMREPPRVMLGLRDILDAPDVVRRTWQADGLYDVVDRLYDEVLVYGRREVFDTASEYGLREHTRTPVHYCGFVCTQDAPRGRAHVLESLGLRVTGKFVVVTAGGGRDAFAMMRDTVAALNALRATRDLTSLVITGPLMPDEHRDALESLAAELPGRVVTSVSDSISCLAAADAVVTMGGYNTLMETVSLNKPTVVIPRSGPSAEQTMRAEMLKRFGAVQVVPANDAGGDRLTRAIATALDADTCPRPLAVNGDGTRGAVERLRAALEGRAGSARASSLETRPATQTASG